MSPKMSLEGTSNTAATAAKRVGIPWTTEPVPTVEVAADVARYCREP